MITVKGFSKKTKSNSPGREAYVVDEGKTRTYTPLLLVTFLIGCAAYLRSFLPTSIAAAPDHLSDRQQKIDANDPGGENRSSDDVVATSDDEVANPIGNRDKPFSNIPAGFDLHSEQVDFFPVNASPLNLGRLHNDSIRIDSDPIGDRFRGGNENSPIASGRAGESSSGGGGSGGGGGGGGGDGGPGRNRPPRVSGSLQLQNAFACHIYFISMLSLLAGASDPDGDQLTVTHLSTSLGTLIPTDGGWQFTAGEGMLGDVTLTYAISDGMHTIFQTAHFSVLDDMAPIVGTDGNDTLLGTPCAESIDGKKGDDYIDAKGGDDIIIGGDGNDYILGGDGDDVLFGGSGDDAIFGGAGNDTIYGGAGNDRLYGEAGDDVIFGDEGNDLLVGGDGADTLNGGAGDDVIMGDAGNDVISGGDGNDVAYGGAGDDVIMGDAGNDTLSGGDGNDVVHGGAGDDVIMGDASNDTLSGGDGNDVASGGAGDDVIMGDAGNDSLSGGDGNDVASGGTGDDVIMGDAGNDTLDGGDGNDVLAGGEGNDVASGGAGEDVIMGDAGNDVLSGGEGNDVASGGAGDDVIMGDAGNDVLSGGDGNDVATGGVGNDVIMGDAGNDTLDGGDGNDVLSAGDGNDVASGGAGDDVIMGDAGDDTLSGGEGKDTLDYSSAKSDLVIDLAEGKAQGDDIGHDHISGFESVVGGHGNDHIIAGKGSISLTGGEGDNSFDFTASSPDVSANHVRKITDFKVGDRLLVANYTIWAFETAQQGKGNNDQFDQIYSSSTNDDRHGVSFRFEKVGEADATIVDVKIDNDPNRDFLIELSGHHQLEANSGISHGV